MKREQATHDRMQDVSTTTMEQVDGGGFIYDAVYWLTSNWIQGAKDSTVWQLQSGNYQ